jgi:hypothetical protein
VSALHLEKVLYTSLTKLNRLEKRVVDPPCMAGTSSKREERATKRRTLKRVRDANEERT